MPVEGKTYVWISFNATVFGSKASEDATYMKRTMKSELTSAINQGSFNEALFNNGLDSKVDKILTACYFNVTSYRSFQTFNPPTRAPTLVPTSTPAPTSSFVVIAETRVDGLLLDIENGGQDYFEIGTRGSRLKQSFVDSLSLVERISQVKSFA